MKWDEFVKIAKELPEVEESTSYGRPSIKVRGKFMAGYNPNEKAFVLRIANVEEQDFLCEMAPELFYITPHYKGYPALLMRPRQDHQERGARTVAGGVAHSSAEGAGEEIRR
jgi:hypothetical protein